MRLLKLLFGTVLISILFQFAGLRIFSMFAETYDISTVLMSLLVDPIFLIYCCLCTAIAFRLSGDSLPETWTSGIAILVFLGVELLLCKLLLR